VGLGFTTGIAVEGAIEEWGSCSVTDVKTAFASNAESFAGSVVTKNRAIHADRTK
jgi:hypothetical protein